VPKTLLSLKKVESSKGGELKALFLTLIPLQTHIALSGETSAQTALSLILNYRQMTADNEKTVTADELQNQHIKPHSFGQWYCRACSKNPAADVCCTDIYRTGSYWESQEQAGLSAFTVSSSHKRHTKLSSLRELPNGGICGRKFTGTDAATDYFLLSLKTTSDLEEILELAGQILRSYQK